MKGCCAAVASFSIISLSSTKTILKLKMFPAMGAYLALSIASIISRQSGFFEEYFFTLFLNSMALFKSMVY